jgi:hypothetical protein
MHTYSLNTLHHPIPRHNHPQPPPTERRNGNVMLHPRQSGALFAVLLQDTHRPELLEDFALDVFPEGVALRVQRGEFVRQLS